MPYKTVLLMSSVFCFYSFYTLLQKSFRYQDHKRVIDEFRIHYDQITHNKDWAKFKRPLNHREYMMLWLFQVTGQEIHMVSEIDDIDGITCSKFQIKSSTPLSPENVFTLNRPPFGMLELGPDHIVTWYSSSVMENNNNLPLPQNKISLNLESICTVDNKTKLQINNQWITGDVHWLKIKNITLLYVDCMIITPKGWIPVKLKIGTPVEVIYNCF